MMVQKILKGCSFLLYLNLSKTRVTDKTLKELFRSVVKRSNCGAARWCLPVLGFWHEIVSQFFPES